MTHLRRSGARLGVTSLGYPLLGRGTLPSSLNLAHLQGSRWPKAGLLCGIALVCFAARAAGYAQAATPAVDDPSAAREFLLQGIAERAAALKSAVFSAHGRKEGARNDEKDDKEQAANGDVFIHGAIDGGRLRFDYREPNLFISPEKMQKPVMNKENLTREQAAEIARVEAENKKPSKLTKMDMVRTRMETYLIKTPTKTAFWYSWPNVTNSNVFLGPANREIPAELIRRFDINALGLYGMIDFERGKELKELLETYRSHKAFEVKDAGKGLFTLTFLFDNEVTSNHWAMDIDTLHGFTATRFRLTEYNKPLRATAITQSSDVTWKQVNGAWVPETFKIWSGNARSRAFHSLELTFTFQQVNQPVDDAEFSYKSFPAPASAAVIDRSADDPVLLRPPFSGRPPGQAKQGTRWFKNRTTLMLLGLNLVMVTILIALIWRRRLPGHDAK
jgi:hypothetical protein